MSDTTAGGKNHRMSLYRAPSGALVFGAGTVQWSWGLDGTHDRGTSTRGPADAAGHRQPARRHGRPAGDAAGRPRPAAAPLDTTDADRHHHRPAGGATVPGGNVTISGTAADAGGVVGAVEVSTDDGATWQPRHRHGELDLHVHRVRDGPVTIQARAVDDSRNIGAPRA